MAQLVRLVQQAAATQPLRGQAEQPPGRWAAAGHPQGGQAVARACMPEGSDRPQTADMRCPPSPLCPPATSSPAQPQHQAAQAPPSPLHNPAQLVLYPISQQEGASELQRQAETVPAEVWPPQTAGKGNTQSPPFWPQQAALQDCPGAEGEPHSLPHPAPEAVPQGLNSWQPSVLEILSQEPNSWQPSAPEFPCQGANSWQPPVPEVPSHGGPSWQRRRSTASFSSAHSVASARPHGPATASLAPSRSAWGRGERGSGGERWAGRSSGDRRGSWGGMGEGLAQAAGRGDDVAERLLVAAKATERRRRRTAQEQVCEGGGRLQCQF